jgi:hypothetical protein
MKNIILTSLVAGALFITGKAMAEGTNSVAQAYEYGMIKWDGSDKIEIITPEKCELYRVFKLAVLPAGIHDEEFCDMWAMNHVAKEGWQAVMIHGQRVMIRRALGH